MVQDGDIICVVCGTNLLTGQKVSEEVRAGSARSVNKVPLVVGGFLVLLVLGLGAMWAFVASRDPLNQARELISRQQYLEAQDILLAYVERVSDDEEALFELGRLQWRNAQYANAATNFEKVASLTPQNTNAALWAVAALELGGGAANRRRQIVQLQNVAKAQPNNDEVWYILALAQGSAGDTPGQIESLERVLTMSPRNSYAQRSLGLGLALQGDYEGAVDRLRSSADLEDTLDSRALMGFISSMQGLQGEAIRFLESAVAEQGGAVRWEALTQLGKLLIAQGRFRDAERYLDQATGLRSGADLSEYLHAICIRAQGQPRAALQEFEEVARSGGDLRQAAGIQVADIYLTLNDVQRARDALNNVIIRQGKEDAPYYTVKGRLSAASGDDARAQDEFRRAISADASYAPAHLENGLLYVKREALPQGLAELEEYLELVGEDDVGTQATQIRELAKQLRQTTG